MTAVSRVICLACLALLAAGKGPAQQIRPGVGAVQKVIEMLTKMQNTCKQEKQDEQVAMGKFEEWCKNKIPFMKQEIVKNGENIEALTAEIGELDVNIKRLGEEIDQLNKDVASAEASMKKETDERDKEHAAFLEEEQDYSESVDALERAIDVLKKQNYDRPGSASALLQLSAQKGMPEKVKSIVATFVSMLDSNGAKSDAMAPEANAYEFQSGSIIDVLKRLLDEFREKLGTCQKEEMNSQGAFDMTMLELRDTIENAKQDIEDKTKIKASHEARLAEAKKEKADEIKMKAENEKTLASMEVECKEKKYSFEEKQDLRTQEIAAIGKAIEILSSGDVSGNAEKHMELAQQQTKTALLQLGKSATESALQGVGRRLRQFLEQEATRLHNKQFSLLAEKVGVWTNMATSDDPFAKVKAMIDAMITRLLKEQEADAEHNGFCTEEMGKNKVTRTKLSEDIDMLTAECEEGKAFILKMTEDVAALSKEVEQLEASMVEATQLRKEEKAKNLATIADAENAQSAVNAATKVLKEFYEKAATATALLQIHEVKAPQFGLVKDVKMGSDEWNALATPEFDGVLQNSVDTGHKEGMQTFGKKYTGMQDSANGVLAMLEVILSDFATLQADTENAETMSQNTYEDFMNQAKKDKAVAEKSIEMKTADRIDAEKKLAEDTADLKNTQDELIAADKYYEKLVPQCVDQGMTWDERQAARQSEIASLKEALKILSQSDVATSA